MPKRKPKKQEVLLLSTKNKKIDKLWYDPIKLLSYNKMVNFVMSHRGGGKTFSAKRLAIKQFLKDGSEFVYLRRYKTELKGENVYKFFDDISVEFPGHKFSVKGHTFYIDGKKAGSAISLSQQVQIRSTPFPNVKLIIFDEFVLGSSGGAGALRYLDNEVVVFLEILSTIVRSRDNVRVLCCANSISYVNPYFDFWKIRINPDDKREFYFSPINDQVIVQLFDSELFKQKMETTRFGQLISGTTYGDYAISNEVLMDTDEFLMYEKPSDCTFQFSLKYDGKIYGCWFSDSEQIYHFNDQHDPSTKLLFAVTQDDHTFDCSTLKSMKQSLLLKAFRLYYDKGLVFYKDQETKKDLYNILKVIGI